ncbi:MAG TPA: GFA family protein [Caulobacteraceae bacterium]|jgi:hypothetical protein
MSDVLTGGCQCGAVRFRVDGPPRYSVICHCRMCQKAYSAPFGACVSVATEHVVWTRGTRKRFLSSDKVARTFCGDCGSQLTFEGANGSRNTALSTCAFDNPAALPPTKQSGAEGKLAWLDGVAGLPWPDTDTTAAQEAKYGPRVSRQHPDHDTDVWPPA